MTALTQRLASLVPVFRPSGIAVIGASRDPNKLSYGILRNLLDAERPFPGPVYPVNPKADEILGARCYPNIAAVPDPVEMAILVVAAPQVTATAEACGQRGIKSLVVISGGFREVGPEGMAREQAMLEVAGRYGMRVVGPNGIGILITHLPLNTTFLKGTPPIGHIGFVSQSGAMCGGIVDWAAGMGIGFSGLLSIGNQSDVNETDLLAYLAADEDTRVITLYLEDIRGGRDFYPVLCEAASRKPVLALKAGRTGSGQTATASHTGALASEHAAFRAACKQAGAIEVERVQDLFYGAVALAN